MSPIRAAAPAVLAVMAVAGFIDTARQIPLQGAVRPRQALIAFVAAAAFLFVLASGLRGDAYMPNSEHPAR